MATGDFWPITLSDGRYAAGRVLQIESRVMFLGCVLDWSSDQPPTFASLSGAEILVRRRFDLNLPPHRLSREPLPAYEPAVGAMHIKAISDCGDGIAGHRDLGLDDIEVPLLRSSHVGGDVLHGMVRVRKATRDDKALPIKQTWGLGTARRLANLRFCPSFEPED